MRRPSKQSGGARAGAIWLVVALVAVPSCRAGAQSTAAPPATAPTAPEVDNTTAAPGNPGSGLNPAGPTSRAATAPASGTAGNTRTTPGAAVQGLATPPPTAPPPPDVTPPGQSPRAAGSGP